MEKDLVYVFDKNTKVGVALGEVQSNFNMSYVVDGTKDSCKIEVQSFQEAEIEPYTIVLHKKTFTWWIVSHDKVERRANDSGYIYTHNLQLQGAIELLNARDLTDCGFNEGFYSVQDFLFKLFMLSDIEFPLTRINFDADQTFLDKRVDFIKTFENYSLLSAIREFLNGYNCDCKLFFNADYNSEQNKYTLTDLILEIFYKTGNPNRIWDIDSFDDIRETKTMSKESFGCSVVSNAENVVASSNKIYPLSGAVSFSSNSYEVTADNAIIRLPTNIYQVNRLILPQFNYNSPFFLP